LTNRHPSGRLLAPKKLWGFYYQVLDAILFFGGQLITFLKASHKARTNEP